MAAAQGVVAAVQEDRERHLWRRSETTEHRNHP
uniref:Uncharacterized protein n=1 Tax=Podoviridae sp. ctjUd6 TaxID=2825270 RepID=A0A8S5U2P8_9CAUD|nr:MAG TPA: hypothetical protein [Podoviridae sp. ctjUd6]